MGSEREDEMSTTTNIHMEEGVEHKLEVNASVDSWPRTLAINTSSGSHRTSADNTIFIDACSDEELRTTIKTMRRSASELEDMLFERKLGKDADAEEVSDDTATTQV